MQIKRFINEPIPSNTYVLFDKTHSSDCIVVDPGSKDISSLLSFVKGNQLSVKYVILTHEHFDHCWGADSIVVKYHSPIVCSELCAECIREVSRNCSVYYDSEDNFILKRKSISIEKLDYKLPFVDTILSFIPTPGHTDASMSFIIDKGLFTGDVLIKEKRTYTKLPTGSVEGVTESMCLIKKLQGKGFTVYPGHGEPFDLDSYDLNKMLNGALNFK